MLTKIENAEQALSDSDLAARVKMNGPELLKKISITPVEKDSPNGLDERWNA